MSIATQSKIVPISTTKPARRAGSNTPVTWGELCLLLEQRPADLAAAVFEKSCEIDSRV